MKLFRIILPVNDLEKAANFYSEILEMKGTRVSTGRHYFDLGGTILACYDPILDGDMIETQWSFHENQYIYISVAELNKIHERIKKSDCIHVDKEISMMPWGERLFYANDPFGTPICFVDEKTVFTGS